MRKFEQSLLSAGIALISQRAIAAAAMTLLVALLSAQALAQTIPSPSAIDPTNEIRRQEERDRATRERAESRVDIRSGAAGPIAPERLPIGEVPCLDITKVELRGDQAQRFEWVLSRLDGAARNDSALGKCLGARGINVLLKRAQDALIVKGFVTSRILAEPQDLKTGVLTLTVIPGRINAIRFATGTSNRARLWNAVPAEPGDILNLRDIEQALENFLRVPSAEADIKIEPAEGTDAKPGFSDLLISYQQSNPFRLSLNADDSGTDGTGKYQGGITLSYDNWWTLNDLFYITANHDLGGGDEGTRGTRGSTVHYSVPFDYWTIGATVSNSCHHQTVAGATQEFTYRGTSDNAEITLFRLI